MTHKLFTESTFWERNFKDSKRSIHSFAGIAPVYYCCPQTSPLLPPDEYLPACVFKVCIKSKNDLLPSNSEFLSLGSLAAEGYPILSWLLIMCFPLFFPCFVLTGNGRGAFMKSERSDSFTSLAGPITGSLTMPQGCWDSSGRSNRRARPTQAHWWCTAGE